MSFDPAQRDLVPGPPPYYAQAGAPLSDRPGSAPLPSSSSAAAPPPDRPDLVFSNSDTVIHFTFNGHDADECRQFIQAVRRFGFQQGRQHDDGYMADYAVTCFQGSALDWQMDLDEETNGSWRLLQKALKEKYLTPNSRERTAGPSGRQPSTLGVDTRVDTRRGRSLVASRNASVVHGVIHIVAEADRIIGYVTKSPNSLNVVVGRSEQTALVVACRQSDGFQEIFLPTVPGNPKLVLRTSDKITVTGSAWLELAVGGQDDIKPMIWRVNEQGCMESALSAAYRQFGGPILQNYTRNIDHTLTLFFMYGQMSPATRAKFTPAVSYVFDDAFRMN
ncbi:hypothetical protein FRB90_009975 [Tulasnella sp. 427]|nr:hypothetical protein FRB90_009975 [Tulasnella sp. 427]